jgi:mitochondrial fission protein ELM1
VSTKIRQYIEVLVRVDNNIKCNKHDSRTVGLVFIIDKRYSNNYVVIFVEGSRGTEKENKLISTI